MIGAGHIHGFIAYEYDIAVGGSACRDAGLVMEVELGKDVFKTGRESNVECMEVWAWGAGLQDRY